MSIYVTEAVKKGSRPAQSVLFLHGASPTSPENCNIASIIKGPWTSQNWLDIKSLHHVAQWGYRAVAIDLPGNVVTLALNSCSSVIHLSTLYLSPPLLEVALR